MPPPYSLTGYFDFCAQASGSTGNKILIAAYYFEKIPHGIRLDFEPSYSNKGADIVLSALSITFSVYSNIANSVEVILPLTLKELSINNQ
jgi:hypothetical protein